MVDFRWLIAPTPREYVLVSNGLGDIIPLPLLGLGSHLVEKSLRKSAQHLVVRVWPPPKLVQWCVDFLSRELSSGARVGLPRYDSWEPMLPTCGSYRRNCYFSVHVMLRCSMYTPRAPGDFAFSVICFCFFAVISYKGNWCHHVHNAGWNSPLRSGRRHKRRRHTTPGRQC